MRWSLGADTGWVDTPQHGRRCLGFRPLPDGRRSSPGHSQARDMRCPVCLGFAPYVSVNVPDKWGNPDPDSLKEEAVPLVVPTGLRFLNVGR